MKNLKYSNLQAFTLVEVVVVILMLSIISFASYSPYAHHQKKILLDQGVREVSQALSAVRNKSLHGYTLWWENVHTYIEFLPGWNSFNTYILPSSKDSIVHRDEKQIDTRISLPSGITLHSIDGVDTPKLLVFEAISWDLQSPTSIWDTIEFVMSYKESSAVSLQEILSYYTQSHISDY